MPRDRNNSEADYKYTLSSPTRDNYNRDSKITKGRRDSIDIDDYAADDKKLLVDDSKDYLRRNLKWLAFSKPKIVSGFDHLGPADLPAMSAKARGISLSFDKIIGWRIPLSHFKNIDDIEDEFTVQLSFSLYHFHSKSFFGSTWMGTSISLSDGNSVLPVIIDVDYNDVIYLISKLTDPSCVGVAEIVISKVNRRKKLISSQYG